MRFSIVTTSLNQGSYLDEALLSVQRQGFGEVEHIVIDGGSTDGSVELLQSKQGSEWQHLRWVSEPDNGQSHAMNKGLRMATGEVIGWLNSDDRYRDGCFARVARALEGRPEVDVLYGDYAFMSTDGSHMKTRREIEFSCLVLLYYHVLYIPTTASFFRRRIFDEGQWLDESLYYAMDHEFYARLAGKGYRFQHLGEVLADFRLHPASKSLTMAGAQKSESRLTMLRHSPVAQKVRPAALRAVCLGPLRVAATAARYTEKLLRGYYFPERADTAGKSGGGTCA